ncbi:hypothetical protein AAFP35_24035 [Gordonia sp. CPCC 206044]
MSTDRYADLRAIEDLGLGYPPADRTPELVDEPSLDGVLVSSLADCQDD